MAKRQNFRRLESRGLSSVWRDQIPSSEFGPGTPRLSNEVRMDYSERPMSFTHASRIPRPTDFFSYEQSEFQTKLPDTQPPENLLLEEKLREVNQYLHDHNVYLSELCSPRMLKNDLYTAIKFFFETISPLPRSFTFNLQGIKLLLQLLGVPRYDATSLIISYGGSHISPSSRPSVIELLYWLLNTSRLADEVEEQCGNSELEDEDTFSGQQRVENYLRYVEMTGYVLLADSTDEPTNMMSDSVLQVDIEANAYLLDDIYAEASKALSKDRESFVQICEADKQRYDELCQEMESFETTLTELQMQHEQSINDTPKLLMRVSELAEAVKIKSDEVDSMKQSVGQLRLRAESLQNQLRDLDTDNDTVRSVLENECASLNITIESAMQLVKALPGLQEKRDSVANQLEKIQDELENVHIRKAQEAHVNLRIALDQYNDDLEAKLLLHHPLDTPVAELKSELQIGQSIQPLFADNLQLTAPLITEEDEMRVIHKLDEIHEEFHDKLVKLNNEATDLKPVETKLKRKLASLKESLQSDSAQVESLQQESEELKNRINSLSLEAEARKHRESLQKENETKYKQLRDYWESKVRSLSALVDKKQQRVVDNVPHLLHLADKGDNVKLMYKALHSHYIQGTIEFNNIAGPQVVDQYKSAMEMYSSVLDNEPIMKPPSEPDSRSQWVKDQVDILLMSSNSHNSAHNSAKSD